MSTLFLSDLHLEDAVPQTLEWLEAFLVGPAREASAIYILGDLFEYWIGDDALSASARTLAAWTAPLASAGLPIYFIHGNRDFLLGEDYARQAGLTLLPESLVTDLHGTPTLLLHGDTLCTDDIEYQAFRRQSRDPAWQQAILNMSVEERLALAKNARDASMKHTGNSDISIMDVNARSVEEAFADAGVHRMIHGHTHRPDVHQVDLPDGSQAERIVLADWYRQGSYLKVNADGCYSHTL